MTKCPHCHTPLETPYIGGKEGWCKTCGRHVGKQADSHTREGGNSEVKDVLTELGFVDRAEQSIWTKETEKYYILFQFCDAGTELDVDTWYFEITIRGRGLKLLKCRSQRFTDCLQKYFLFRQLLESA